MPESAKRVSLEDNTRESAAEASEAANKETSPAVENIDGRRQSSDAGEGASDNRTASSAPSSITVGAEDENTTNTSDALQRSDRNVSSHFFSDRCISITGWLAALIGVVFAAFALYPALNGDSLSQKALSLAQWTALKDYREQCNEFLASGGTSADCERVTKSFLPPPPYVNLTPIVRHIKRFILPTESRDSVVVSRSDRSVLHQVHHCYIIARSILAFAWDWFSRLWAFIVLPVLALLVVGFLAFLSLDPEVPGKHFFRGIRFIYVLVALTVGFLAIWVTVFFLSPYLSSYSPDEPSGATPVRVHFAGVSAQIAFGIFIIPVAVTLVVWAICNALQERSERTRNVAVAPKFSNEFVKYWSQQYSSPSVDSNSDGAAGVAALRNESAVHTTAINGIPILVREEDLVIRKALDRSQQEERERWSRVLNLQLGLPTAGVSSVIKASPMLVPAPPPKGAFSSEVKTPRKLRSRKMVENRLDLEDS